MANNSPYLWNPPEGADTQSVTKIQNDRIDEILNAPLTGEDIAYKVSKAQMAGQNPNLTFEEFELYDEWHKKQEINWWEVATSGAGMFFKDIGAGLASLQPFGEGHSIKTAAQNWIPTNLGATAVEALGRGTRDMIGLYKMASENQNSPFYRLFNPNGDKYQRFIDFNHLADWNATSTRIMEGKENVLLPDTQKMLNKDISGFSPSDLFKVNNALAHAGSYFLDPVTLLTLGGGGVAKTGLTVATKAGAVNAAEAIAKNALKEGVTGAVSAARNTASIFDKGRIMGSGLTEKLGKAFRVSGEVVDYPINKSLNWIKRQADELFDTNLHQTPNGNLRVTAPTKGQAGFGGSILAGFGLGTLGLPYASMVVPVWAVANAAKIGGAFFEGLGKEMATGGGALKRLGGYAGSSGKLARTFDSWSPMTGYVKELSKAVAKSGLYGTGIGYAVGGEEGAAQGLGMGAAIGTTHYHYGVAHNMFKGQSREKMTADLIGNISSLREKGFTKKADTVLKYLDEIRTQHGDDAYFRNLGIYLAVEADAHVALDIWDKEDYLRIANDPSVPQYVRDAVNNVIKEKGQSWNGYFLQRRGDSKPYFIRKDSQSGITHIIINAWALDDAGKRQATGLKGEFYHALSDAYKQASTKEKFKEEIFEGLVRTLNLDHTPEGRANMAQILRNAAENLDAFNGAGMRQKASSRAKNLLRLQRKNAPVGWKVDFVTGNTVITEGTAKRPPYYWESSNGWRIVESSNGYDLVGRIEGKPFRKSYRSLSEAVAEHKEIAPIDTQVKATPTRQPRKPKATQFEAQAGPRAGEREGFQETVADVELGTKVDSIIDTLVKKVYGKSLAEMRESNKAGYETASKLYRQALNDGWVFDEARVDTKTENDGFYHPDYPNAKLEDWYNEDGSRKGQEPATPPNVAGERTSVTPEAKPEAKPEEPKQQKPKVTELEPEEVENIFRQIDEFEKTGKLPDGQFASLIEELGESVFDAFENDVPFDYLYLAGDLGFARNLIEEMKHRFSRIVDRNGRQAGFVPDFNKSFVEWFKDKDGKAIYDPYMRDLFKKFLSVHQNRKSNLDFYNVDWQSFSPSSLKAFIEENNIEHEFDKDPQTGNYTRKSDEVINREQHQRYQAAFNELINLKKSGVDIGFEVYALDKDSPDIGSLDEENASGALKQQAWKQYRTTVGDIREAQRKGTIPTKEELEQAVQKASFGKRGRARTGEIDDVVATAKNGSIIFSGIPTLEAFKVLQKHMMKNEINAIMQIAPVILEGGINAPNVLRVKYAGFTHAPEEGKLLKKPKNEWKATEKNMVFYHMELRGTLRNLKTGKFDYKKPHAHFLLHGVDIDVLQRRIQWMWKNEKETRKRWANLVDFEKDVYRLIENYSARSAVGGSRFFGGGSEGKAKKRLACAAIGAFPTRAMVGGIDGDDIEVDMPEIDWHHYQFRAYGKGNAGRDIPWTILRGEGIKKVYGTEDTMRVPYAERAYYRAQELFQQGSKTAPREGDETPANLKFVSQELQGGRAKQIFSQLRPTGHHLLTPKGYTPNDVIKSIVEGQFKLSPEKEKNALAFIKGGIGHDEATNSALVFWHWAGSGVPFEKIEQGQIGLHIGTREAALYRAMKVSQELGQDPVSVADNTFPLVVNIKKPLTLADRGSWTPDDVVDAILYANLDNDARYRAQQPRVESFYDQQILDNISRTVGPLTPEDINFLKTYKLSLAANKINASNAFLAQAEMVLSKGQSPRFESMSKRMYKAAEPLHKWLESKGIDGIRYRNGVEGSSWSYIVFSGKQVKHLVKNSGEYSPQNLSMMRQQASRFGAKSAEDAVSLESNYRRAIQEGDIFKSIAIKENFLGGLPAHARVIRQTGDEAIKQGVTLEQYNQAFTTGTPVVFPVVKAINQNTWSSHLLADMEVGTNSTKVRALYRTNNPLVIDANGLEINSPSLSVKDLTNKALNGNHDSLVILNTLEANSRGVSENSPLHNKVIGVGQESKNNVAIIDDNTSHEPVPRGNGLLIGDTGSAVPFRQQASKKTFYSAVERFVEEKVTDKTSLEQLIGMMDPAKGTGLTKAELTWLDIEGWVREQKAMGAKKIDKNALLEHIRVNKVDIQEVDPSQVNVGLSSLTPQQQIQAQNNPAIQQIISDRYAGYTVSKHSGQHDLQPQRNYRVFLIRGPVGADYGSYGSAHFADPLNIIGHLRVTDKVLDAVTETIPAGIRGQTNFSRNVGNILRGTSDKYMQSAEYGDSFVSQFLHLIRADESTLDKMDKDSAIAYLLDKADIDSPSNIDKDFSVTKGVSPFAIIPTEAYGKLASIMSNYSEASSLADSIIRQKLIEILEAQKPEGTFGFIGKKMIEALKTNNSHITIYSSLKYALSLNAPRDYIINGSKETNPFKPISRNEQVSIIGQLLGALIDIKEANRKNSKSGSLLNLLFIEEGQSDTAQGIKKMRDQFRTAAEEAELASLNPMKKFNTSVEDVGIIHDRIGYYGAMNVMDMLTNASGARSAEEHAKIVQEFETNWFPSKEKEFGISIERIKNALKYFVAERQGTLFEGHPDPSAANQRYYNLLKKDPESAVITEKELERKLAGDTSVMTANKHLKSIEAFIPKALGEIGWPHQATLQSFKDKFNHRDGHYRDFWADTFARELKAHATANPNNFNSSVLDFLTKEGEEGLRNAKVYADAFYNSMLKSIKSNLVQYIAETTTNEKLIESDPKLLIEKLKSEVVIPVVDSHFMALAGFSDVLKDPNSTFIDMLAHEATLSYLQGSRIDAIDVVEATRQKLYKDMGIKQVLVSHPFEKTDQWLRLEARKAIRVALEEGKDGIQLVPADLPAKIVGSQDPKGMEYFYGVMWPKILNQELKKFGMELRPPKSFKMPDPAVTKKWITIGNTLLSEGKAINLANASDSYSFLSIIGSEENLTFGQLKDKYAGSTGIAWHERGIDSGPYLSDIARTLGLTEDAVRDIVYDRENPQHVEALASAIYLPTNDSKGRVKNKDFNKKFLEVALQTVDSFDGSRKATIQESMDANGTISFVPYDAGAFTPASERGLLALFREAKNPQKLKDVLQGQPMYQAASRKPRKPKAEGQSETVGDIRGLGDGAPIAKKQDRSIGERPEGSAIPEIPKQTSDLEVGGIGGIATSIDKKLATEGVADYRGYKIIYDKANGGYRITNPSGKMVPIPVQYKDKITGEMVIKNERTVVFPSEATFLIDYLLGGMPKTSDAPSTPALAKPAQVKQQVVEPAQRAIPKANEPAPVGDEAGIVQSQIDKTGKSKYYLYNIEFDSKTGEYMARDNAGQVIPVTIDNPFQSGPRLITSNRVKSLPALLSELDKKFDKTKYARFAPKAPTASAPIAPVVQQPVASAPVAPAPVAPVAPVTAVEPPTPKVTPKKRVPASSVPKAVAQATPAPAPKPTPAPKPKSTPKPKQNVNTQQPRVVMPEEVVPTADAEVKPTEPTQPIEVVSDKEHMERQAKALGKGFIEMMKDPELSQFVIDSLNVDDNLTLKGDNNSASTADGRFSVDRKGKKYVVMQNNYQSPITGLNYDRRTIAYVNTLQQAQILIRRLEVERNMQLKMRGMPLENPLMVMAAENPAFEQLARDKAIRDNALIMMLLSMRDQGIIPIYIDPNTLQPILVMMPSEEAISQVTRPPRNRQPQIAGLLPESGGQEKLLPAVIDDAIKFDYIQDAQIRQMSKYTKDVAERYRNRLGYEILKFQGKFRLFNPLKASVSVRDDEDAIMNDLIKDLAKKGLQQ